MKKILLTISLAIAGMTSVEAQMYVSPNSYVFVNDQYVYVKQDVNLDNNGNFYLRNNSQLLQASTTAGGTNRGLGNLSVFQEGTADNFRYNYWCSPVGVPAAAQGNSNFGVTRLFRPSASDKITSVPANVVTSNGFYDGVASNLTIAARWVYTFSTSNAYAQWTQISGASAIAPGLGFTMKGTSGTDALVADLVEGVSNNPGNAQRYDFRGLPNDGNISNAVSTGNFTLVGNPYPSAIDLDMFLLDPANAAVTNGQAYFWEQASTTHYITDYNGGYGTYAPGTHIYTPAEFWNYDGGGNQEVDIANPGTLYKRWFTPIGQGFMVLGTASGNVTMKNAYRVFVQEGAANNSEFARTSNAAATTSIFDNDSEFLPAIPNVAGTDYTQIRKGSAPHLRINAYYNDDVIRPTAIAFVRGTTQAFDHGFDARSASDAAPMGFYYVVSDMPYEYVNTTFEFDVDARVPVGFRCANETNFKVQVVGAYSGFDDTQKVYMYDKATGIYYDIKDGMFEVTLPAGDNRDRYEVTFRNTNDVLGNDDLIVDSFVVYQNNDASTLTISNTLNKDVVSLDMYDVTGKKVVNRTQLGKAEQIEVPTSNLSDGIYIVKLQTSDNVAIDKKVSIFKK